MVSTFTPNINLEEPARNDDVGTWDTPVNANTTLIDLVSGGITTISLNNSPVVLSAAQFQSNGITFNSTLTGSVAITFPTSFKKPYFIRNTCTGSSAFVITLQTTASGGQAVCCPPGESVDVVNDGTNLYFHNLGRIGEFMDIAGSSMPNWISGCTVAPYLNCDGTTFSAVTFPALATRLGGTTLPDSRSRARIPLAQGVTRVTTAISGVDGATLFAVGGDQSLQAHVHVNILTDPGHTHGVGGNFTQIGVGGTLLGTVSGAGSAGVVVASAVTGISLTNASAGSGSAANMPPTYVGGLTLIRAA